MREMRSAATYNAPSLTALEARNGSPITVISLEKKARCAAVPVTSVVIDRAG